MGLFGLFATVLTGGAFIASGMKNADYNRDRKERAIQEGRDYWSNHKGEQFLLSTGEKVYHYGGQLRSVKTGRVIIDYNKRREYTINSEALAKAKQEGKKYARLMFTEYNDRFYYVELSTMKRYWLSKFGNGESSLCHKSYYVDGMERSSLYSFDPKEEKVRITYQEYLELGGYSYDEGFIGRV